ncbi:hypothetical protein MMC27_008756 [Xylographa pallens]|nr:hypothetical protein [Xylographa pallens]
MAVAGLRLLSHLQRLVPTLDENPAPDIVTSLAAFTDPRDPWTRPEASETASALLVDLLRCGQTTTPKFLSKMLASLLQDIVRPRFAKTKNSAITEQGRKANYRLPDAVDFGDSEVEMKQWKFRDVPILTVFRWILGQLDETTIQEHWPLVIPPLLAILDDEAIDNKIKGCEMLITLLNITPSLLLQKTGLGEVFQDALIPYLSYLPSLTSEEQSISLLDAVYPTLLLLLRARYPGPDSTAEKTAVLDQMVRMGILDGFSHAGEYVKIATVLMNRLSDLVNEMGIMSVKHLKDLLPLISDVLSAPFGPAHPPLMLAATVALQAIILNDWPRVGRYQAEILKGLVLCWYTMNEDACESYEVDNVKIAVQQDIRLLRESVRTKIVEQLDMDQLLHDDHQLSDLLKTVNQCA